MPMSGLANGFRHYEVGESEHEAVLLNGAHKVSRKQQPALRVLPANQRLNTSNRQRIRSDSHFGLILKQQLVLGHGALQLLLRHGGQCRQMYGQDVFNLISIERPRAYSDYAQTVSFSSTPGTREYPCIH